MYPRDMVQRIGSRLVVLAHPGSIPATSNFFSSRVFGDKNEMDTVIKIL